MVKPRFASVFPPARLALAGLACVAATVALSVPGTSEAATFGVRVVDDGGMPVAGAAVCVGLEGNYRQFGTGFTDLDGRMSVDVPNVPLVVTVSKTRFTGTRTNEPARGFNLVREVRLFEGVPGPRCRAGSSVAEPGHAPILIRDLDIDTLGGTPTMRARVTGEPTHYRIGSDTDLESVEWQRFAGTMPVPGSLADEPTVYLQLRRYAGTPSAWLEARSDVTTVELPTPN